MRNILQPLILLYCLVAVLGQGSTGPKPQDSSGSAPSALSETAVQPRPSTVSSTTLPPTTSPDQCASTSCPLIAPICPKDCSSDCGIFNPNPCCTNLGVLYCKPKPSSDQCNNIMCPQIAPTCPPECPLICHLRVKDPCCPLAGEVFCPAPDNSPTSSVTPPATTVTQTKTQSATETKVNPQNPTKGEENPDPVIVTKTQQASPSANVPPKNSQPEVPPKLISGGEAVRADTTTALLMAILFTILL
ncbi:uncharacterized protein VTP21DRAFT_6499 [Calcarisporiella thermophila]|uniref:uncharacterized protein n=1 Tax=Calcarisporiella thermophila TaxID=911321 RepID=UPI0037424A65